MTPEKLKEFRKIATEATPGPWGPWSGNYPFNVDVVKPAPSLSKYDSERPTYWRYQDGRFVLTFNPKEVLAMLDYIDDLETVLESGRTLTRQLDIVISGWDGAAKQASLCDLIGPARDIRENLDKTIKTLLEISVNTYGTEPCNTDEENNEILAGHFFRHQNLARQTLADIKKTM